MGKEEIWKLVTSILGGVAVVGGFIYWHFKTVNGFKDELHKLELRFKDHEQNDKIQQQAIDRLMKFYTLVNNIMNKNLNK